MLPSSLYDQKLLFERLAEGDVAAFRIIFDAYRTRLYAAALKITHTAFAAEDIVQETFMSLWEGRANLERVEDPPAYIFTIAYNKTFRYLKKMAADSELLSATEFRVKQEDNQIHERLDAKEILELIQQAVQELPPQRQLIYKLSREEGLSHEQIANQLHISPLTVKKQITLALQNIRLLLAKMSPLLAVFFLHE